MSKRLSELYGLAKFVSFLHKVVQSGLTQGIDDIWKDTALQLQAGWMHIHGAQGITSPHL